MQSFFAQICMYKRMLSHGDYDHMGEAINLVENFKVEKEKDILEKYNVSKIDVLKIGHHGSKTSSDKNFIDEMNPKYSVISVGKNNRYGHPNKEVLNNLDNSKIYRTDINGEIKIKIKRNNFNIKTYR